MTLDLGLWAMNESAFCPMDTHAEKGSTHIPCDGEWLSSGDDLVEGWQVDRVATWIGSDRQLRAGRSKASECDRHEGCCREIHLDVSLANVEILE